MAHRLNALEGLELLFGASLAVGIGGLQIAVDDFDGLEQPARRLAFPDLTKAATTQAPNELVTRDWLCSTLEPERHEDVPV